MLNLYEILEVSEKASKEVIDKAYRVLAKKYHPDLQTSQEAKEQAENTMKKINEAYEILGNDEKRREYDIELQNERDEEIRRKQIEYQNSQRVEQRNNESTRQNVNEYNQYQNNQYENAQYQNQRQEYDNMQALQNEMRRVYANAYNDYWRSRRI